MLQLNGVSLPSPPPELLTIQLPVISSSVHRSCQCLGGESHLNSLLVSESASMLFQPPNYNSLHSALIGHKSSSITFVFKIRMKKNQPNESAVMLVGKSVISYSFNQPSDYQFLPSSTTVENVSHDEYLRTHSDQCVIELIPRLFAQKYKVSTKNSKGKNILNGFETNLFRDGKDGTQPVSSEEDDDGESAKSRKKSLGYDNGVPSKSGKARVRNSSLIVIGFNDPVPMECISHNKSRRNVDVFNEVKNQLLTILEFRPCIIRYVLETHARMVDNLYLLAETINECCFTYKTGPFISSICPVGYDPTADPNSRYFQSFRCKFPPEKLYPTLRRLTEYLGGLTVSYNKIVDLDNMMLFDVSKKVEAGSGGAVEELEIVCFGSHLKTQVCNLNDESLFQLISSFKRLPVCTQKHGWFLEYDMNRLRELSMDVIETRVQDFLNTFDPKVHRAIPRTYIDLLDKENLFVTWQNRYSRIPDALVTEHDLVKDKKNIVSLKTMKGREKIRRRKDVTVPDTSTNREIITSTRKATSSREYEGLRDTLEEVAERVNNRPAPGKSPRIRIQIVEESKKVRQPTKITPRLSKATTEGQTPNNSPSKATASKRLDEGPNMNDILQLRGFDVFGKNGDDTETSEEDW